MNMDCNVVMPLYFRDASIRNFYVSFEKEDYKASFHILFENAELESLKWYFIGESLGWYCNKTHTNK